MIIARPMGDREMGEMGKAQRPEDRLLRWVPDGRLSSLQPSARNDAKNDARNDASNDAKKTAR